MSLPKPASPLKLAGNRRNALRPTGSTTAAGKRRVALNTRSRGMIPEELERQPLARGEDPAPLTIADCRLTIEKASGEKVWKKSWERGRPARSCPGDLALSAEERARRPRSQDFFSHVLSRHLNGSRPRRDGFAAERPLPARKRNHGTRRAWAGRNPAGLGVRR
jgi:hypothetical protein